MIKIVKGVYGHMTENGIVKPKTEKDEPFSLTAEQEARLVELKVAKYVDVDPIGFNEHPPEDEEPERLTLDPKQLAEMTNAQLKELAEDMGIDTKLFKLTTKAKLIEAITSVEVEPGPEEDDDEELPAFDPAEAVQ